MPKKNYVYCWEQVPLLIDIPYASVLMGVSPETVRRELASGKLKGNKVGREWRILKSDIMARLGANNAFDCTKEEEKDVEIKMRAVREAV